MSHGLEKYKGIHPGFVLERELKKRSIKKRPFAQKIDEHPQTLNSITKGNRGLNIALALKIERELNLEEGSLAMLQTFYEIQKIKEQEPKSMPDLTKLRNVLFWDTRLEKIDWQRQRKAVIERVFERGNEQEQAEIMRFYGDKTVQEVLKKLKTKPHKL